MFACPLRFSCLKPTFPPIQGTLSQKTAREEEKSKQSQMADLEI